MEVGKYILVETLTNASSVNSLYDLVFKKTESIWTAQFNSDQVTLKTQSANGESCELVGHLETQTRNYAEYAQYFAKSIKHVYQIERKNQGSPYGGCLIIFSDDSTGWIGYGSGMQYVSVRLGYLDNTKAELMGTIGWV
jgi:hypothetical protein